jgi:hypothetical protein
MGAATRFHLAIAVDDLDAAAAFYGGVLGCEPGRAADNWMDWDLFGHQLVTHHVVGHEPLVAGHSQVDGHQVPVPHFGVLVTVEQFHELSGRLRAAGTAFVLEPYLRFAGAPGEQWTMFLYDPAGNAIEFKAFAHDSQVFAR